MVVYSSHQPPPHSGLKQRFRIVGGPALTMLFHGSYTLSDLISNPAEGGVGVISKGCSRASGVPGLRDEMFCFVVNVL